MKMTIVYLVMRSSPRWIPGMANGVYVRSYRELPIKMSVD